MIYWVLGGVLFLLIYAGWLWYEIENAPLIEDEHD